MGAQLILICGSQWEANSVGGQSPRLYFFIVCPLNLLHLELSRTPTSTTNNRIFARPNQPCHQGYLYVLSAIFYISLW